jgi:polyhydroxyalkanoate synthase subunit PhaE
MAKEEKQKLSPAKEAGASMMNAWLESQKLLWESWVSMVSAKAVDRKQADFTNPLELWNNIVQESTKAWTGSTAAIARSTAEGFLSVQETGLRFMEFTAKAWEALEPKMATGEDWQGDLREVIEQFRQGWLKLPETAAAANQDINQLWELYLKQWQAFGQPWDVALRQAPEYVSRAVGGDSTALVGLSNLYQQAYQDSLARLVSSPGLGMTREFNDKFQQGFDAWVSWQLATLEYQGVVSEIWEQAFEKFFQDLLSLAEKGQTLDTLRDLILLWTRGAEDVFTESFRSEAYVLAQGKMLNASMKYRVRERAIIETFLDLYDLPTRSELDEAHRRIYELRKEVKVLKKAVAALQAGQGGGAS